MKIGVRVDIRPVGTPRQNGELAREREQDRQVHAHPVGDVDRLLGVVDADVHVQAEQQLLPGDEAKRVDDLEVARPLDDALLLPLGERVGRRGGDREPLRLGGLAHAPPQVLELARRPRPTLRQTLVAISSTDCISSGLTSPSVSLGTASIISSIAETSSIDSASTIISSSSTPRV